jgi:hypothetical protein
MGNNTVTKECGVAPPRAIKKLVRDNDMQRLDILAQAPHRARRKYSVDSKAFHSIYVGLKRNL